MIERRAIKLKTIAVATDAGPPNLDVDMGRVAVVCVKIFSALCVFCCN